MGVCWMPPPTRRQRLTALLLVASVYTAEIFDGIDLLNNLIP